MIITKSTALQIRTGIVNGTEWFEIKYLTTAKVKNGISTKLKSKAPVSQLVNADDTSVIEIKTQLYLES